MEHEPEFDLEEEMARLERALILDRAIERLPKRYKQVIELSRDEMNEREIGFFLDRSAPAVRSTLFRARKALKNEVRRVAKKSGQWPLPALVPWASFHPRHLFGRLRARLERFQDKVAWATQAGPAGVFTNLATGVVLTVTLTGTLAAGSIYLLQRSDPEIEVLSSETRHADRSGSEKNSQNGNSSTVSAEANPTIRTVSSEISSKAVAPNAPEASTNTVVRVTRGERTTISAKAEARFGDIPLIEDEEDDLLYFYCDEGRLNGKTCATIDTIPST